MRDPRVLQSMGLALNLIKNISDKKLQTTK
jgi:hypothetical protein